MINEGKRTPQKKALRGVNSYFVNPGVSDLISKEKSTFKTKVSVDVESFLLIQLADIFGTGFVSYFALKVFVKLNYILHF